MSEFTDCAAALSVACLGSCFIDVVMLLYFSVPPTAAEADLENVDYVEPKIIPTGEVVHVHVLFIKEMCLTCLQFTAIMLLFQDNSEVHDHSSFGPDVNSSQFSLTPEMTAFLQNISQKVDQNQASSSPTHPALPSPEEIANLPPHMKTVLQTYLASRVPVHDDVR